jgi:hypothetical protein
VAQTPVANNDTASVCSDSCVNVSVLDNDTAATLPVTLTVVSGPTSPATATVSGNKINFCANNIAPGDYTFTYTVAKGDCTSNTGTVTVTVTNCGLVATDDSYSTTINTCKDIQVTINDYDPEYPGDQSKLWIIDANVTDPLYGNASLLDSHTIRYCPDANWCGIDIFKYRIQDVNGSTADANVTITVPCPPVDAIDDYNTTDRFTCVDFNITDNDDGSGFKVQIVPGSITSPTFGNVSILDHNGTIRFCPQGYCGTATFDYNATNGFSYDRATVTVEVPCPTPVCPVAVSDFNSTTMNTCVILNLLSNDYDPNGDPIHVIEIIDPPHGVIEFIDFDNGIIRYCPDANYCGSDFFEYTIIDSPRSQDDPCESTTSVRIDVICEEPKEKVPAALLYPLIDIERLTLTQGPVPLDGSIGAILDTGTNIIIDGKVIAVLQVTPGSRSLIAQVDNLGFVTQNDVRLRFEDLPQGVSVTFSPESQKIKAHNVGTYVVTLSVSENVPKGSYFVNVKAFTRSGTLDSEIFNLVIN